MKNIADKKWFVPLIIIILSTIVVSSFTSKESKEEENETKLQLEQICSAITGESVNVMITYENKENSSVWRSVNNESISGVAIICNSGDDPSVKLKIYEVVKALFNIPSTRINVSGKY